MPLRNLYILVTAIVVSLVCYFHAPRNRYASTLNDAMNLITREYLEEVEPRVLFEGAMAGMAEKLDPYSAFSEPKDFEQVEQHIDQKFGGIGVLVEMNSETKRITVMSPLVGTPAYKAGLKPGDVIMAIDGKDTEKMSLKDCVELIHGPVGKSIKLAIGRTDVKQPLEFNIERASIKVDSVLGDLRHNNGKWRFQLTERPDVAYIRMIQFGKETVNELQQAIAQASTNGPLKGVIIDLRQNAGGLLEAAVETCDLFLDEGEIVSTRGRDSKPRRTYSSSQGTIIPNDVPVVVLVDRYSASASEIVAACLQDHKRATIVGQRTWGKGTVQNLIELPGKRGALRLTVASYWRPNGKNIHKRRDANDDDDWGVRPNDGCEVLLSDEDQERVIRARRQRDGMLLDAKSLEPTAETKIIDNVPNQDPTEPKTSDEPPKLEDLAKLSPLKVDPQLQKAFEVLDHPHIDQEKE